MVFPILETIALSAILSVVIALVYPLIAQHANLLQDKITFSLRITVFLHAQSTIQFKTLRLTLAMHARALVLSVKISPLHVRSAKLVLPSKKTTVWKTVRKGFFKMVHNVLLANSNALPAKILLIVV